jgi:hypothetical protein
MRYYVRVTYYDDTPTEMDEFDTREEAMEAYQSAVDMRRELGGSQFGDCQRISVGSISKTRKCITDYTFD